MLLSTRFDYLYWRTVYTMSLCALILTRPHTHSAISAAFDKIAIFYPDTLNGGMRCVVVFIRTDAWTAAPVSSVCLIIHFDYTFAGRRNDAARVEHHAGYRVVVGVCIIDGASPKIPDLIYVSTWGRCASYIDLPVCFCLRCQSRDVHRRTEAQ